MKKYVTGLLLILSVAAQSQTIKGKVCLEKDKTPAPFATVGLVTLPDSSMTTGAITLTDGGFLLDKVKPGNYLLKVSYVGYQTELRSAVVAEGQTETAVDTIFLKETTTTLNEVEVVAEKLKGKEMVDRTVYSVPQAVASSSNTGYDILKKIPQVNVDFQNNITLNGSANFIIQVDGRQRDREFLAKLLPSDIESIEIISNPSGKYEGNIDGVINIVLKKEARYGISGNASLSTKPFNKPTNTVTGALDYALGKITFYATGFSVLQKLDIRNTTESRFTTIDSLSNLAGMGAIKVNLSSLNTGFDYYMDDKNNLSFNLNLKPINQDINVDSKSSLFRNNVLKNSISSTNRNSVNSDESSVSLFYQRKFKKAIQEFTGEFNYYWFTSNDMNDFANAYFRVGENNPYSSYARTEENFNKRQYFSSKLNYVHPFGIAAKLETGYQFYYQDLSYDFIINKQESEHLFNYAEMRHSVYGGLTFNLKKVGIQTVLRVENSHIKADSVTSPDYACFLPSVNLQYKFSASHNLKFTYNRRINRPGIYDMDPYYKIGQNYDITQGNPDLRPDYRDRLQLTYTWNFGSNYFSPYVYQEYFSDRIGRQIQVIPSPVNQGYTTLTKPYNLLNGYETGGGMNAMLWFVNINARLYKGHYNEYTGSPFTIPAVDYFSYSITSYAFAQLDKKKTATAFVYLAYNGITRNAQSKTYNMPLYGFGGQKQLKNHSVGIFWLLPFSKDVKFNRTVTETPVYTAENTVGFDVSKFIQFTYSYKFNKGKNVKKLNRQVQVESDSKSQTIGR